jgi:hypothetical protein
VTRLALCIGLIAACGDPSGRLPDAGPPRDAGAGDGPFGDATTLDAAARDAATLDAPPPPVDAFPGVLDLRIDCHNDCVLTADPAAIAVPAGTSFEVNWINVGDTECDVAKIDEFNQVPIIIGLEPGTSYHDPVHDWCGDFTGTFDFRVSICTLHSYIPVDCNGM